MSDVEVPRVERPDDEPSWREGRVPRPGRRPPPSLFWPILLVGAGVVLLLSNLGYLSWQSWNILWRLWPLLLIAIGIDLLIGHRSTLGAIVSGLLILALLGGAIALAVLGPDLPLLSDLTRVPELQTRHIAHPLGNTEQAEMVLDWGSATGSLSALDGSANLIEGDVSYRGTLIFNVNANNGQTDVRLDSQFSGVWWAPPVPGDQGTERWDVGLSPDVPLELDLDTGAGQIDFDLGDLQIERLILDSGSGTVDLTLPAGSYDVQIDSGSGRLEIRVPESVAVRVELETGSGAFDAGERLRLVQGADDDDQVWETENADTAEQTIRLIIEQGSGAITIR